MNNFDEDCEYIIKNVVPSKTLPRNIQKIVREKLDNIIKTNKLKNIKDLSNLIEQYIFSNKDKIRFSTAFINAYDEYKLNELNKTDKNPKTNKDIKTDKNPKIVKDTKTNKDIKTDKNPKIVKDTELNKSSKIVNNKLKTKLNDVGKFIKTKINSNDNYDKLSDCENSDNDNDNNNNNNTDNNTDNNNNNTDESIDDTENETIQIPESENRQYKPNYFQRWDNPEFNISVQKYIETGKNITIVNYLKKHVMYFIILKCKDPMNLNRVICKIGYTNNLHDRIKSLKADYNCEIYIINLRTVDSQTKEKEFHNMIQQYRSDLWIHDIKNRDKLKDEFYVFDEWLVENFSQIKEFDKDIIKNISEIESKRQILILKETVDKIYNNAFNTTNKNS